jgi:acyl-CoA synthetase (AMP-forming)/AMP-acid ligase II/acyl carrier protein/NRPS condensation-like uncharacterized protein
MVQSIYQTIFEALNNAAITKSNSIAYSYYLDDLPPETVNFKNLQKNVTLTSSVLSKLGQKQDRVLITLTPGLDYLIYFLATSLAGLIPVPAYPPNNKRKLERLLAIANDCSARYMICSENLKPKLQNLNFKEITPLFHEDLEKQKQSTILGISQLTALHSNSIAFLQYTSGSTDQPKGLCVSHSNIITNLELISKVVEAQPSNHEHKVVHWLPPFHDMGMIFGLLFPLYRSFECHFMSPDSFVKRPISWLELISKQQATLTAAPNFAFELCNHHSILMPTLDLSSLHVVFNGAEPINAQTVGTFIEKYTPAGFKANSMYPAYGLAESTLYVTSHQGLETQEIVSVASHKKRTLVNCGKPGDGHKIKIIDPDQLNTCHPKQEGEIWVSGKSVAQAYWEKPEISHKTFKAQPKGEKTNYLRTGDLGFISEDGDLYISGRIKDLIVINGQNIYPQDVENLCQKSSDKLTGQGTISLSIEAKDECEVLIILQEVHRHEKDFNNLESLIREVIYQTYGISPYKIIFVREKSLPRTSSGKVQRQKAKKLYLQNCLKVISERRSLEGRNAFKPHFREERTQNPQEYFLNILSEFFPQSLNHENLNKTLIQLGLDSLQVSYLMAQIKNDFGVALPTSLLLGETSLKDIIELLNQKYSEVELNLSQENSKKVSKNLASPAQEKMYFLDSFLPDKQIYNIPIRIHLKGSLDISHLCTALEMVLDRHEILRTAYVEEDRILGRVEKGSRLDIDFHSLGPENFSKNLSKIEKTFINYNFCLSKPLKLKAAIVKSGDLSYYLLLNFHHIVFDGYSLRLFLQEISYFYNALLRKETPSLPSLKVTYLDLAFTQRKFLKSKQYKKQIQYWRKKLKGFKEEKWREIEDTSYNGSIGSYELDQSYNSRIKQFSFENNVSHFSIFCSAYFLLRYLRTKKQNQIIGIPVSGRKEVASYKVIGLMMNVVPIYARLTNQTCAKFIRNIHQLVVEAQENQDVPFDLLVKELGFSGNLESNPLFQDMFLLREDWEQYLNLESIDSEVSPMYTGYSKLEQTFIVQARKNHLDLQIDYMKNRYSQSSIASQLRVYSQLLSDIMQFPDVKIFEVLRKYESEFKTKKSSITNKKRAENIKDIQHKSCALNKETQEKLKLIWKEILNIERIGINDNFFKLGGHSLLVNKMLIRIRKEFDCTLSVREVFSSPTIELLSQNIDEKIAS